MTLDVREAGDKAKPLTSQGSQVVKAAVCKTVYRWFDSIPWDHDKIVHT